MHPKILPACLPACLSTRRQLPKTCSSHHHKQPHRAITTTNDIGQQRPDNSLTTPNFILVFGDIMDELNGDDILSAVSSLSGVFAATGAVAFVSGTLMVS